MKTTGGLKPWGLTRVKVQKEKSISDRDQDVKGAGKQGIEGVKGEFPGAGRTHQIHGECKEDESVARRSSFQRSFRKVVEMDAEQEGMHLGAGGDGCNLLLEMVTKATREVARGPGRVVGDQRKHGSPGSFLQAEQKRGRALRNLVGVEEGAGREGRDSREGQPGRVEQ